MGEVCLDGPRICKRGFGAMSSELLIYDDNPDIVSFISRVAEDSDFTVCGTSTDEEFWAAVDKMNGGAIILDLELLTGNGISVLKNLAERRCAAPILLISGYHEDVLMSAERLGTKDGLDMRGTLHKPFGVDVLTSQLENLR